MAKKDEKNVENKEDVLKNPTLDNPGTVLPQGSKPEPKMVQISEEQLSDIMGKLKMLEHVADKGRLMNYESNQTPKKKSLKAQLSLYGEGIITGWRTVKDELIKHPTTGSVVGETQEYELLILNKDDTITKASIVGYPAFSNARYNERIEVEITGKKEDFDGKISYDVRLPDGRVIKLDPRFIN